MLNNKASVDARQVLTGKDGALFNDKGVMMATVESYNADVAITNSPYQPLGDPQSHDVFTGYKVTLSLSQVVIEDDSLIKEFYAGLKSGRMPSWNFQGVLVGRNGSEERVIYRDCVPSGNVNLQNLSIGDVVKRSWTFTVNSPPDLQSFLTVG